MPSFAQISRYLLGLIKHQTTVDRIVQTALVLSDIELSSIDPESIKIM